MQSITVNSIYQKNVLPLPVQIPLIDHSELDSRVQAFLQERRQLGSQQNRDNFSVCRKLFQNNSCELYLFPRLYNLISSGPILSGEVTLFYTPGCGVVLCFFPKLGTHTVPGRAIGRISFNPGGFYPSGVNCAFKLALHHSCISYLVCEHAWIDRSSGLPVLRGLEINLLESNGRSRSLFCKKVQDLISPERPYSFHLRYKRYLKIFCECKHNGFSCSITLPVLSEAELKEEIAAARCQRAQVLNVSDNDLSHEVIENDLFPDGINHHLVCFPFEMGMGFPFCRISGGDLFFSYSEDGPGTFRIVFLSRSFREGRTEERCRGLGSFHFEKFSNDICTYSNLSTRNPFSLSGPQAKIVHGPGYECHVEGISLRLISNNSKTNTAFGLCLSRQKETESISNPVQSLSLDPGEGGSGLGRSSMPESSGVIGHPSVSGYKRGAGRSGPVSGISRSQPYPSKSSKSKARATVSIPPEREGQQQTQMAFQTPLSMGNFPPLASSIRPPTLLSGSSWPVAEVSYLSPYPLTQGSSATVSIPPEREGQQQEQMAFQVPLSMGNFPPLASSIRPPTGSSGMDDPVTRSSSPHLDSVVSLESILEQNVPPRLLTENDLALENLIDSVSGTDLERIFLNLDKCFSDEKTDSS